MLMHSALEGWYAVVSDVSNYFIWKSIPNVNCSVDKTPASRDGSGNWYCESMERYGQTGAGSSSDYTWLW